MTRGFLGSDVDWKYNASLKKHIKNVQQVCRELGVPRSQWEIHDQSKYSDEEYEGYARKFYGEGTEFPPDENMFARAWLHHLHLNPHHWQHWIFPMGYRGKGGKDIVNGIVKMPEYFALEMIGDWLGANKTYQNSWDMSEWLKDNIPQIRVHPETANFLYETLKDIGYSKIVDGGYRFIIA